MTNTLATYRTGTGWPIAYAYDADLHCIPCGIARFGSDPENGGHVPENAEDSEGNLVGAFFDGESTDCNVYCGDCLEELRPCTGFDTTDQPCEHHDTDGNPLP